MEEIVDEVLELSQGQMLKIEKKAQELRAEKKLRVVYPLIVEGNDYDEKPLYVGYFQQPTFKCFSKYLAASQSNQVVAMRALAEECFVDGDKELVSDDSLFLFGLMGQLGKIIEMRHGKLVNLSKPGK